MRQCRRTTHPNHPASISLRQHPVQEPLHHSYICKNVLWLYLPLLRACPSLLWVSCPSYEHHTPDMSVTLLFWVSGPCYEGHAPVTSLTTPVMHGYSKERMCGALHLMAPQVIKQQFSSINSCIDSAWPTLSFDHQQDRNMNNNCTLFCCSSQSLLPLASLCITAAYNSIKWICTFPKPSPKT